MTYKTLSEEKLSQAGQKINKVLVENLFIQRYITGERGGSVVFAGGREMKIQVFGTLRRLLKSQNFLL